MKELTISQIAKFCDGQIFGNEDIKITNISTDSRKIENTTLFIPLVGENFDGHDFINVAIENGACAVLSQKQITQSSVPVILVNDTLKALGAIAKNYKVSFEDLLTVAVTGSVGKTTTKEMIYSVLSQKFSAHKTEGNFNNEIGLPLTVFAMPEKTDAVVLEMGMNHMGEISRLTQIAQPDICAITNIGISHIEYLGSRENISKAKLEILEGMRENGKAVFNGDEPLLWNEKQNTHAIYYGIENSACDIRAKNIRTVDNATKFDILYKENTYNCLLNVIGQHNVLNALCAFGIGVLANIDPDDIINGLLSFQNAKMRQNIYKLDDITIIDDCYNASPDSIRASLSVLDDLSKNEGGRKIAVLGGMGELGDFSKTAHIDCGKYAGQYADLLVCYTQGGEEYRIGAIQNGLKEENITICKDNVEVASYLANIAQPKDIILFKGSRFMKMEQAIQGLKEEREK